MISQFRVFLLSPLFVFFIFIFIFIFGFVYWLTWVFKKRKGVDILFKPFVSGHLYFNPSGYLRELYLQAGSILGRFRLKKLKKYILILFYIYIYIFKTFLYHVICFCEFWLPCQVRRGITSAMSRLIWYKVCVVYTCKAKTPHVFIHRGQSLS